MERVFHNVPPVFSPESEILILGTMPSPKSREAAFYYAHPQNRFWPVLSRVYGVPLPDTAEALLGVARLRAECARLGLREIAVTKGPSFGGPAFLARFAPLALKTSQQIRLKRLSPKAVYKEEIGQLQVPVNTATDLVDHLVALLRQLVPAESA